ncbi:TRAP transporter substrate-binding protein [Pelagibacterium montanilacus]|uniref:TRAP transporter substrate-binding protein n=1 Tax=Pelagibacterium montanilacus TaxID=2185280 RepID=UPI000F8C4B19|nr:TRAP transporter substrate-binding protein [Pelagibacterium montanilacus]
MTFKKRFLSLAVAGCTVLASGGAAMAQIQLTLADIYNEDHSNTIAAHYFADLVDEKTNGEVQVNVFPNSTIGSEREIAESLMAGSVDIAPSGLISRFFPELQILELPYLYRDLEHMQRVADAIAPEIEEIFRSQNAENLGFLFLGPRSIAGTRPIRNIEDMEGFRLRVPELPLYVGMTRALGATPTPVAFNEAYTSLETGVADGAEGEPATLFTQKWYEPAEYVSLTQHIWHFRFIAMNGARFNELSEDHQQAIREAAQEAQAHQAGLFVEFNEEAIEQMRAEGAEIVETEGLEDFAEAVADFQTEFAEDIGPEAVELLELVRAVD